ncbi:MAG: amidohydrolase, partial [Bacteroidetes bacterium]
MSQIPTPAPENTKKILLLGGYLHVGNGKVIEDAAIGIDGEKLVLVADARTIRLNKSAYDTVIHIGGKHVYPGFIAPNSTLGLVEIDAVRATRDFDEAGKYNPNVRSIIAYNPESKIISTVRTNGVLIAQITPRGGRISGKSSIVELDAWNWEDALYKEDDGIHINWPPLYKKYGWWAEPGPTEINKKQEEELKELYQFFFDAAAYFKQTQPQEKNLRFEALKPVFENKINVYIHANYAKEIMQIIDFKKEFNLQNVVIIGGIESWKIADVLKENNISVMVERPHSLPSNEDSDIDEPFKLPYLLQKAGVLFCIQNAGDMEAMNTRNLPFLAGTAMAYGLSEEEAVQSITLNAAKILGIDKTLGSVEEGKDATIFISEGNALNMKTNQP